MLQSRMRILSTKKATRKAAAMPSSSNVPSILLERGHSTVSDAAYHTAHSRSLPDPAVGGGVCLLCHGHRSTSRCAYSYFVEILSPNAQQTVVFAVSLSRCVRCNVVQVGPISLNIFDNILLHSTLSHVEDWKSRCTELKLNDCFWLDSLEIGNSLLRIKKTSNKQYGNE